jgi:hypothetical protein
MGMTVQPINTKIKNIIKLRSNHPASIREMIQSDFAKRLQSLELGLQKTLERFEAKYPSSNGNIYQSFYQRSGNQYKLKIWSTKND